MDPNNSNIDNVMIIMVPRKELICLSKFIQVLPKLISEALDVLRGKLANPETEMPFFWTTMMAMTMMMLMIIYI